MSDTTIDRPGELLQAAIETARSAQRVQFTELADPSDGTKAPAFINGSGVHGIARELFDEYRAAPVRRKGTATLTRVESFIEHVERFKDAESVIFASDDPAAPKLAAVLNYHPSGDTAPRFGDHRSVYAFPLSPEWRAWSGKDGQAMSMIDFASFLEDHIVDVLPEPGELSTETQRFVSTTGGKFATPTKLIEIARGLQVNESAVVKEARNLATGEAEILFDTTHTGADGKPLKLPNLFVIAIPVFAREPVSYRLIARFRYRKTGGGLVFFYELWRRDLVFNHAFEEAVARVGEATGLPILMGSPES